MRPSLRLPSRRKAPGLACGMDRTAAESASGAAVQLPANMRLCGACVDLRGSAWTCTMRPMAWAGARYGAGVGAGIADVHADANADAAQKSAFRLTVRLRGSPHQPWL